MSKILVTGGAGFIGSHLVDKLLSAGHHVVCFDNLSGGEIGNLNHNIANPNFSFVIDSILNRIELDEQIAKADVVVHLAADVGIEHAMDNPVETLMVNVRGTVNVLASALKNGKKKVILASSSEVYGKNINKPLAEEDDLVLGSTRVTRWSYSSAKIVDEQFGFAYSTKGLPVVMLRVFNTYGPRINEDSVVSIFIKQALSGQPITVAGDGFQKRCFTYVDNVVHGIKLAMKHPEAEGEVINLGTSNETTILELAELIKQISGSNSEITLNNPVIDPTPNRVPDTSRARKLLSWEPVVSIEEGLRETIKWMRDHG